MSIIYYSRENNRTKFVELVLEQFINKLGDKLFIKPNIVSHEPYPTTTHLEMITAVITCLNDRELAVGDASAVDCLGFNVKKSAINDICNQYNVPLIDLYSERMKVMRTETNYKFNVSQVPLNYDSIISLPVLKVHGHCQMTGALKCAFGYLSKGERLKMHTGIKNIHRGIAELNTIFKPTVTIMDAIETLRKTNEVRHGGKKAELNILLASDDPVALDIYGLQLLKEIEPKLANKTPQDIKHLKYAINLGLGSESFELIELK
ncbi:MAG: DUF362 domain-containing protein [Candidatus Helarchaeota archaeon]